jgi:hypothetical protein
VKTARGNRNRRWVILAALLVLVTLVHLWVFDRALDNGLMDGESKEAAMPTISVAFVKHLAPTTPPVAAAPKKVRRARPRPLPVAPVVAASSPETPASAASAVPEQTADAASAPPAQAASAVAASASSDELFEPVEPPPIGNGESASSNAAPGGVAPPMPAASAASAAGGALAFDWPPSTQLNYNLVGNYRGPLYGSARVEWLRKGDHYQVRVSSNLGPMVARRLISDGRIGPNGLEPQRFDQETDLPMHDTRRETVKFEGDHVTLVNGKTAPTQPGMQDSASQFVQLTWLFLTHPDRLKAGEVVEFPLALPRRAGRWRYQVAAPEMLNLPFGKVQAYHLVPQVPNPKPNEAIIDIWVAPSLQYLPVKVAMRLGTETTLDMTLKEAPLQADH